MRSQPQKACGDDFGNGAVSCLVPADACAVGWHICADTGEPSDLTSRLTSAECATEPGSFVGAAAHCENCAAPCMAESDCVYKRLPGDTAYGCPVAVLACSEPACCGASCGGNNNCKDAFFTLSTRTALRSACGAMLDTTQDGVLCCAD